MSVKLLGALVFTLLTTGLYSAAKAQMPVASSLSTVELSEASTETFVESSAAADAVEVAQSRRRRRRNQASGANFIGIGADFGYADDVSFAAISRFGISRQLSVRPSVLVGDDFSILVPVTYEFTSYNTSVGDFQVRPYAGGGASYSDDDDDDDFDILIVAGADVPLSQRFTLNAQANLGVLDEVDFGATIGVGYNF